MQFFAVVIAALIESPSATAANAIAEPTMARINAYSAAEAPLSSMTNDFTNLTIIKPLVQMSNFHSGIRPVRTRSEVGRF